MSAAAALARGRAAAEALMLDAVTITRVTGRTTDPVTSVVTDTTVTVYTGKCKVQAAAARGHRIDTGEDTAVLLRMEIHLPVATSAGVALGDLATITTAVADADLSGRKFRVHDLAHKSFATARRLGVEEVT